MFLIGIDVALETIVLSSELINDCMTTATTDCHKYVHTYTEVSCSIPIAKCLTE